MAYAKYLVDLLRGQGLTVHPYKGWETRGGSGFNPVGVMLHHTATWPTTPDATVDKMLAITGSSRVKAPLCNYSTNRDGSISVIAAGTANHGGAGTWQGVSGNSRFFGDEMKNLGTPIGEPWSQIQLEAARLAAATLLDHIGQPDAKMLCGHKEYATPAGRKPDPHTLSMNDERQRVEAIMAGWYWDPKNPQDIDDLADADAVAMYQGGIFAGNKPMTYLATLGSPDAKTLEYRTGVLLGHAREIQELMLQGERIRKLGG